MSDPYSRQDKRSPFFLATLALAGLFALLLADVVFFGSEKDGNPVVVLPLAPFTHEPTPTGPGEATTAARRMANGNLVADPDLIEDTQQGPLPKLGPNGRAPMNAYAASFDAGTRHPRIAIILAGLGVGANETNLVLARLPPSVTVAFSPFDPAVQSAVDTARGGGHEVLVEVPMEPFDFPDSDPGPRTLMVAASADENQKHLAWMLTRFTGYVGAVNSQGGRFVSEASALEPVVAVLARRGLIWVDASNGDNSATAGAATRQRAVSVNGAMRIDAIQTAQAIDAKLLDLEDRAKESGFAVGVASAYPVSVDRIAQWAQTVGARGYVLAPISAVAVHPH